MSATGTKRVPRRPSGGGYLERAQRPGAATAQSASARSPFTPIADYGFLSNCHTGALVAPDGTVDWLCVPRFDSPSVFGALLDRGAGGFRFGPFGINVPSGRIYEPGTNSLVTSWKTPTGWVVVRDALTMGPSPRGGHGHTPHPAAVRRGRRATCWPDRRAHRRHGRDRPRLRALRLRSLPGEWTLSEIGIEPRRPGRAGASLQTDMLVGIEGAGLERATSCAPASWSTARSPGASKRVSRAPSRRPRAARGDHEVLARLALAGGDPRPRARAADRAVGADDQGPHVHADGATVAALTTARRRPPPGSATGTTATPGSATRPSSCGRCTTCCWIGRPTSSCSSSPTSTATTTAVCRSCTGSTVAGT